MSPKLFLQPSVFMQRVGHLRVLLRLMRGSPPRSFESWAKALSGAVTKRLVPPEATRHPNIGEWIRRRQQDEKYATRAGASGRGLLELQDAYLSDPTVPSYTGTLTAATAIDIVRWGVQAGLVRERTGVPTSIGDALCRLDDASVGNSLLSYDPDRNPYSLRNPAAMGDWLTWSLVILSADWVVLSRLLPLLPVDEVFDRTLAGDLLPVVMDAIRGDLGESSDRRRLAEMRSLGSMAEAIRRQRGSTARGLREHQVAIRLEPLVDLGLLHKQDPYRWQYVLKQDTKTAIAGIDSSEMWPQVTPLVAAGGLSLSGVESGPELWKFLAQGFRRVTSPVGFAGLTETILAGLWEAGNSGRYFEWEAAKQLVAEAQRAAPALVRFNVDRYGALRHIRLPSAYPM